MHNYVAYGLGIESAFALPELHNGEPDGSPDVVIEAGSLTPVEETADTDSERRVASEPDRCRISYEGVGTFQIESGERIVVDTLTPDVTSSKVFRRLLEGQVLGVCCHLRDLLVLHGSAVQIDGEAVVFLGPTGAGKSTTAAAFYTDGYPLLDDDIVVIDTEGAQPTVGPGVPQLKLTPEMSDRFDIDSDGVAAGHDGTEKTHYRTETDGIDHSGVPLGSVYVLEGGATVSVEPVSGHDALFELIANTYTGGILDETDRTAHNFTQCTRVISAASVNTLSRPADLTALPDMIDAAVDHVTHA